MSFQSKSLTSDSGVVFSPPSIVKDALGDSGLLLDDENSPRKNTQVLNNLRKQNLANHLLNYTNNNSNLTQHGVIKSNRFIDQRSFKNLVYQNFNQNSYDENLEYNNLYNPYADENERMENFQLSKSSFGGGGDDSNDNQTYTSSRDGQFGFDRTNTIGQHFKNSQTNKPLNHTVVNNEFKKIERVNTFSRLQYARNIQFNNYNSSSNHSNVSNSSSQQFYQNYTNLNNNIENIVPSQHQSSNVDETFKNYDLNDDFWLHFDS